MTEIKRYLIGCLIGALTLQLDAKEAWNADPDWVPYYEEYKFLLSVHLGIEIGINF